MKRIITFVMFVLMAVTMAAQSANTQIITFLGIPVDGKKTDMYTAIKNKGFTLEYIKGTPVLQGRFNGKNVHVFVSDNNGIVDRIYVAEEDTHTETDIRIEFNNLMSQFERNGKYESFESNERIPEDEDISYEMAVNNKRYEASFYLKPDISAAVEKLQIESDTSSLYKFLYENKRIENQMTGIVWFTISEYAGKYYISLYYDNMVNRPHGEDL